MNIEESQILANVATALANSVSVGVVSREEAKGILKPFLPKKDDKRINTVSKTAGTITKQAVTTTTDVK